MGIFHGRPRTPLDDEGDLPGGIERIANRYRERGCST
jgi:hypothetical protein